jgi:hypothetical protein
MLVGKPAGLALGSAENVMRREQFGITVSRENCLAFPTEKLVKYG